MAAFDGENEVYKQLPPYPEQQQAQHDWADYWTVDRVLRWLDVNEFKPAIDLFKAKHICGKTFLDIDMAYLMSFSNDLALTYTDKRKLAHAIKSLRTNEDNYSSRLPSSNSSNSRFHNSSGITSSRGYSVPTISTTNEYALPSSDSVIPLIPERKSSNNEQVLDWMKTFNIPKRPIPPPTLPGGTSVPVVTPIASNNNSSRNNNINQSRSNSSNTIVNTVTTPLTGLSNNQQRYPNSPSSPRVTETDGTWKFVRRRPNNTAATPTALNPATTTTATPTQDHPIQLPTPPQQTSIHVTRDSDTFHSLNVTGMHDPRLIKNSILRKLGLEGGCDRYLFYHENGKHSETALTDNELSHICQISDHSSTNRILVKPAAAAAAAVADHALDYYRSYSKDGINGYDFAVVQQGGGYQRSTQPQQQQRYLYAEPRPLNNTYNGEYEISRSRYDLSSSNSGMISPINGNSQYTMNSPEGVTGTMEDSRDDSGYFGGARKQSIDANAAAEVGLSIHPPQPAPSTTVETVVRPTPPLWAVTPQSQRSSTSSSNEQQQQQYHYPQQQQQQHLWPVGNSSSTELASSYEERGLWPIHQDQQPQQAQQPQPQASFWAVPPKQQHTEETITTSQSLWAIPPSNNNSTANNNNHYPNNTATSTTLASSVSLWAVAPSSTPSSTTPRTTAAPTPSPSLWAIPPSATPQQQLKKAESSPAVPTTSSMSSSTIPAPATAVPSPPSPIQQFGSENLVLHPSISNKTHSSSPPVRKRGVQFTIDEQEMSDVEDAVESITLQDPPVLSIDTSSGVSGGAGGAITPVSPRVDPSEEENWAERPSVERLYKDIDKYLPGHDLDKEIIIEPTAAAGTPPAQQREPQAQPAQQQQQPTMVTALPPGRRLQGHKKSIRNVANEAHRNWRNAVNVIRANNLLRRRSTKMWHRTVEQVKPGMKANIQPDDYIPKSKKLQWIRGELIGKGSFGRVYHALNVEAGEWIAVKQVDLPVTKADYANPQLRETKDALFREISLLEDLDNEYIVQYLGYDVDEDEGHINIFLEYVPGGSIASCLSKTGKFDEPLVRFFTRQILMGLAYLHNRNILHRDIKAGNILLDQNGVCKITDFGLSKLSGQDKAYDAHSNNSVMRGTVFWMAPEVVKGTNYNAKIDIWSLGCTVIEMLTGSHPWLDLNMLAALYSLGKYQAPPIPEYLPEEARDFLNLCFTINPEDRPTAEQLLMHPFVQPDASFEFKKYMKKAEIERRASRRMQATISVEN